MFAAVYLIALLLASLFVLLGHMRFAKRESKNLATDVVEGSFRIAQPILLFLVAIGLLGVSIPLFLSFRERVAAAANLAQRLEIFLQTALGPIVLLFVLLLANRKKATGWVMDLNWPRDER